MDTTCWVTVLAVVVYVATLTACDRCLDASTEMIHCRTREGLVHCNSYMELWGRVAEFDISLVRPWPSSENDELYFFCIGLLSFRITFDDWLKKRVDFNGQVIVGEMDVSTDCWDAKPDPECDVQVLIDELVLAQTVIGYDPTEADFWNFTDSAYSPDNNWLQGLHLTVDENKKPFNLSLDQIYLLENTSIKDLSLVRVSEGADDLKLGSIKQLRSLTLRGLQMRNFPCDGDCGLPDIEILDVSFNCFSSIPVEVSLMKKLKKLNLAMNGLCGGNETFQFDGNLLEDLHLLQELDLSGNGIKEITTNFPPLQRLLLLNLSGNNLQNLDAISSHFPNLKYIDASKNSLTSMEFLGVIGVSKANLSHNQIFGSELIFKTILEHVDLSYNNFSKMVNCICNASHHIKYLDLSHNKLSFWSNEFAFGNISNRCVLSLNLSFNSIPSLTTAMGQSLDVLDTVDLGGNFINCSDCTTPQLQRWLSNTHTRLCALGRCDAKAGGVLLCDAPPLQEGMDVSAVVFDQTPCLPKQPNYVLIVGVPLITVLGICSVTFACLHRHRFEILYMMHLLRVRKQISKSSDLDGENFVYDAFVCYSGSDRAWVVGTLMTILENGPEKYRLCLHDRDFRLGSIIIKNIVFALENSKRTIMILSNNFLRSKWCQLEVDLINHKLFDCADRDYLIMVELEQLKRSSIPRHLRLLMDTRTYLEWPMDSDQKAQERALLRLKRALGASCFSRNSDRAPLLSNCGE